MEKFNECFRATNVWLEFAGRYYLAKITGDAQYNSNLPELVLFHTRACEIKEIGGLDVVPGDIQTQFIRGRTIHRVHSSILYDYSIAVYHGTLHQVEIQDILAYLSSYDLEDLVGLYLQYKLDYKIIPSTCKPTTKRRADRNRCRSSEKRRYALKSKRIRRSPI